MYIAPLMSVKEAEMEIRDSREPGWFWMDNAILDEYASRLGVYGIALYAYLCRRANSDGKCWPSTRRMREDLGISRTKILEVLKALKELNLVHTQTRHNDDGSYSSTLFTLLKVDRGGGTQCEPGVVREADQGGTQCGPKEDSLKKTQGKNQETTFPQPEPEAEKNVEKGDLLTEQQNLTNDFYNRLQGRYRVRLEAEQYAFHLGQFRNMLKKYDDVTEEEKLRVIAYMVDQYPAKPRIRAPKAMQDVRLGRDTGEAWQGEAPWEKAKRESEPDPYKNIRDFTLSSKPQPKKQTEEEKQAIKERMEKMRRREASAR